MCGRFGWLRIGQRCWIGRLVARQVHAEIEARSGKDEQDKQADNQEDSGERRTSSSRRRWLRLFVRD